MADCKTEQLRWYEVVERLTQQDVSDGDAVQSLLQQAVLAAQADDQWANSGMMELLCRARDSAANGFPDTARKAAVGLLGFHSVVERYRVAHPAPGSFEDKKPGALDAQDGMAEVASAAPAHHHHRGPDQDPEANNPNSIDATTASAPPHKEPRKRRRSIAEHIEEAPPGAAAGLHGEQELRIWHGPIYLRNGAAVEEFCSLAMQVPSSVLDELPPVLQACSIKPRRGLRTKGQIACRTSVTRAGPRQLTELYTMAQHELVAIMPLDDCAVILAPYLTEAVDPRSKLNFKVATFIAALSA